ncbi:protein jag [bacterium (Candidatus Blackallbacteria) CG17_big_fil_post_rev_8_21_14_2_50_48_46]|uniref:RNA-binding protein KhpB n=1 Tax=bacterium (Candidatus Blackallbacteria) CG17_big_fil_post_rev_8_21_14_2_50_48_46 TaxID=2014261 RepID=A0A2M7G507_9BACT|nr:MAG: protein jag [bacterium (Candidatus Blackallbacteria) CG18_big_fil_WC_8_21_14_2_50_49_26]PIW17023.1 MAG: protein jag [bacterium (Candidatus Blackallbacteria) CG17_big_fil_post_rev_8_21_14_2_50_48_46]PIW48169.1 MAG: protein jag [bacterium (Candidatus Blackallbacteria) CG13_big_fil_rev_8_21_14_2_50_49_14]
MQLDAIEKEGETVDEALQYALEELETDLESVEYEVLDEGEPGDEDMDPKPAVVRVWLKNPDEVGLARESLLKILAALDLEAQLEVEYSREDRSIFINIISDDAGILIGRQGLTLDSLQYLLQLVVNSKDLNIILDVANYRERHKDYLVKVAEQLAERVLRHRRRVTLKPMDARDRKIIHEAVKPFPELSSSSVGVEPNRRVVISLKRADYAERPSRGGGGGNRYRYNRHSRYYHNN